MIIAIIVISGVVGAYIYLNNSNYRNNNNYSQFRNNNFRRGQGINGTRGNFQLNQIEINAVTDFFKNNPSSEEITNYCNNNRMNCFYYCRNINTEADYCKSIMNYTRSGNYSRNGNYTRQGDPNIPPIPGGTQ